MLATVYWSAVERTAAACRNVACREERLDIVRALTKATCLLFPGPGGSILQVASAELAGGRAPCVPQLVKTAVFLSVWHANEYVMLQDAW